MVETTADEVDDLQLVAFVELSFYPAVARHDVAVQFHGHAVGFHAEDFDEGYERKRIGRPAEIALFAVDVKFHWV